MRYEGAFHAVFLKIDFKMITLFKRHLFRAVIFLCVALSSSGPLDAAPVAPSAESKSRNDSPLRFAIVRSAAPGCEPKCAEWISAEGMFRPESESEFRKILPSLGKRKLPLLINSPGGDGTAAIVIGQLIRAHQLDVAIAKTELKPCDSAAVDCLHAHGGPPRGEPRSIGAICASACTLVLAAGTRRFVPPWSAVGVHQGVGLQKIIKRAFLVKVRTFMTPDHEIIRQKSIVGEKDSVRIVKHEGLAPEFQHKLHVYLKGMGISDDLETLMAGTPAKDIHWMSHEELITTHMATDYYAAENLIAQSVAIQYPDQKDAAAATTDTHEAKTDANAKAVGTSFGFALFRLPNGPNHEVPIYLELLHKKDAQTIEMNALLDRYEGFNPAAFMALSVQFGLRKQAPVIAVSTSPSSPITGEFPAANICADQKTSWLIRLSLAAATADTTMNVPTGVFDLRRSNSMRDFLAEACKA